MLVQFLVVLIYSTPSGPFSLHSMLSPHTKERREQQKSDCFAPGLLQKGHWVVIVRMQRLARHPVFSRPRSPLSTSLHACGFSLSAQSLHAGACVSLSLCVQNLLSIRANLSPIAWRLSMKNAEARRTALSLDTSGIGAKTIRLILADEIFPPKFSTPS